MIPCDGTAIAIAGGGTDPLRNIPTHPRLKFSGASIWVAGTIVADNGFGAAMGKPALPSHVASLQNLL